MNEERKEFLTQPSLVRRNLTRGHRRSGSIHRLLLTTAVCLSFAATAHAVQTTRLTAYDAEGVAGQNVTLEAMIETKNLLGFWDSVGGLTVDFYVEGVKRGSAVSTSTGRNLKFTYSIPGEPSKHPFTWYAKFNGDGTYGPSQSGNASIKFKAGKITGASPSSFSGAARTVTVPVKNIGRDDAKLIVEWSAPSGWSISPSSKQTTVPTGTTDSSFFTFSVTPPASDSTGTITWKLYWDDAWPAANTPLGSFNQSVNNTMPETITRPSTPSGPSSGYAGQSLSYSTSASSSKSHSLQYRFDWGDGTTSTWGSASRSKTYSTAGTYSIKAQARCATDTSVESPWSDAKTVTISWASLSGKISNRLTGLALAGATVSVSGPASKSTTTDSAGNYSIKDIPNGSYDLRIQKAGYTDTTFWGEPVNGNTTINKGIDPLVTITGFSVSPATVAPGGRLTVTYNLQNSGASQTVWLGASAQQTGTTTWRDDPANDKFVTVPAGSSTHTRYFDTTTGYPVASYLMLVSIWQNKSGGQMVERYHERQQANAFTVAWSSLSGKVTNRFTGLALTNASVSISGPTSRSTLTDSAGNYSFTQIPSGNYNVTVTKAGYLNTTFLGEAVSAGTQRSYGIDPAVTISSFSVSPATVMPGGRLTVTYNLQNSGASQTVWLGASAQQTGTTTWRDDPANDKSVTVPAGSSTHTRYFDTTTGYPLASYNMLVAIWQNKVGANMVERYHERQQANAFTVAWSSLSGKVTNRFTGLVLTNASVSISGPTSRSTLTDSAGNYSFTQIPAGNYNVTVTKAGYLNTTFLGEAVSAATQRSYGIDPAVTISSFTVSPATVMPGGRLTVTYNLQNSGASQTVWLGASAQQSGTTTWRDDPANDKSVTVPAGSSTHTRYFDTTTGYPLASYNMLVAIWQNKVGANMVERYHERQQANAFSVVNPPVPKLVSVIGVPATATIGQAFTVTVTARNNGGQTTEGAIHAAVRYADGSVDSLGVSAISGASWADALIRFAPGEGAGQIYNKGQCTARSQAARHFLLEAADQPWPANTERSMSFTVTPRKAGKVQVLVRSTMYAGPNCSDWLNDISADTSRPTALDEQGWDCRVYEAQAVGSAAKIVRFAVPTGTFQPGTRQQVTVEFQNTGSDARKVWVGLSFEGPNAEVWPGRGWLDVPPIQVPRAADPNLAPGGTASVTFDFVLPDWMPDGPYIAHTALWKDFNEAATRYPDPITGPYTVAGLMVGELARTNWASFTIQPRSETDRYGLAGNDPGGLYASIPQRHKSANLQELPINKSSTLRDANQNPLSPSTPNVLVLFHGWRNRDPYQGGDWYTLKNRLLQQGRLPADWRVVPYAWGEDSETGFWLWRDRDATSSAALARTTTGAESATIVMSKDGQTAEAAAILVPVVLAVAYVAIEYAEQNIAANSTVAAYRAYMHGLVLGERLCSNVGIANLKKVQIVAHSAGCWGAYAAMRYIRANAPLAEVQVTYLDPFIPANILSQVQQSAAFVGIWEASSKFNSAALEATKSFAKVNTTGCFSSDCYWSMNDETYWGAVLLANVQDVIGRRISPVVEQIENAVSPKLQESTKVAWTWADGTAVSWRTDPVSDLFSYSGHAGPIKYYADSVSDPGGAKFAGKAWQKSLAANGFTRIIRLEGNLAFGEVQVNTSAQRTLTIYNDGNSPLTVTGISYPNAVFTGNWSGNIPASGSRDVTVTFKPTVAQSYSGNLTVNANHTSGTNTRSISGAGVPLPAICVTPPSQDFGAIQVGATADRSFSVQNCGGGILSGSAIVSAPFSIVSGGSYNLSANQSQNVVVRYSPTSPGSHSLNVTLTGGGGATRPVTGSAYPPPTICVTPPSQDFGAIQVGATADRKFSVQNCGGGTLSGNANVSAPFSIVSGASYNLSANQSTSVVVRYTPSSPGSNSQNVTFSGGGGAVRLVTGGAYCGYSLGPTNWNPPAGGGTTNITVTAAGGCSWMVSNSCGWVSVSTNGGTGNGMVAVTVPANTTGSTQSCTLTIAGKNFVVTQPPCTYSISPASANFPPTPASGSFRVTTTGGCPWTAFANDGWISITSGSHGSSAGTVSYTIAANPNAGSRTGTITAAGQTFTINQAGDTTRPTNTVTAPTPGQRWSNAVFTAQGTARDNVQVAKVRYQLNGGPWSDATTWNNWTNWAANVTLVPGTNTMRAYAVDAAGNNSTTNTVTFTCVVADQLLVRATGQGALSPNYSNAWLEIGRNYSMTATPRPGFAFTDWIISTNWIGGATTNRATVRFTMQSNLTLQVNFADVTKPTNTITSPTAGQRLTNTPVFTVTGKARDNAQVAHVWCQVNGGAWTNASSTNGWTNWTAAVRLLPGTNWVKAYATDAAGNRSTTNSVSFVYVATGPLRIQAVGRGTLSPNYSNAWLEIGRNYSMTATPRPGFAFTNWIISTNWIGGATTNNATVQFMMQSNLTLQVNFADVTKPTITITSPTAGQKMTNAVANVKGTASDNWQVSSVRYQLNSGAWSLATSTNGWTNWTVVLPLVAGTNVIKAYAVDLGGNASTTNTVSVVSSNAFKMNLSFSSAQPLTSSGLELTLEVSPGLNCRIEVSTNLVSWTTLTNFTSTCSRMQFRDPEASNHARRFYRAVVP